jgi:hypothetical protein
MMMKRAAMLLVCLGIAACGAQTSPVDLGPDPFAAAPECTSGVMRDANESEGELMMPGHACNACHSDFNASMGEASPIFRFAGTVYPSGHEPDNCVGSGAYGADVWVQDATGFIFSAKVNRSGNFMLETTHAFVPPFLARVRFQGRERYMLAGGTDGDCNSCHTQDGTMNAPGRIVLP